MSSEPNLHGFCFKIFIFRGTLKLTLEFCRSLILRLWKNFTSQHWPHRETFVEDFMREFHLFFGWIGWKPNQPFRVKHEKGATTLDVIQYFFRVEQNVVPKVGFCTFAWWTPPHMLKTKKKHLKKTLKETIPISKSNIQLLSSICWTSKFTKRRNPSDAPTGSGSLGYAEVDVFWGKTTNLIKATQIIYTSEHLTAGTQIFGGLEDEQP